MIIPAVSLSEQTLWQRKTGKPLLLVEQVYSRIKVNCICHLSNAAGYHGGKTRVEDSVLFFFFSSPFTSSPSAELDWVWVLRTENSHPGQTRFLDLVAVFTSQANCPNTEAEKFEVAFLALYNCRDKQSSDK